MQRRNFLVAGGAFVASLILRPQLAVSADAPAAVLPEACWDIGDRWRIQWSGFLINQRLEMHSGNWYAYPIYKGRPDQTRLPFFQNVTVPLVTVLSPKEWGDPPFVPEKIYQKQVQTGLNYLMWMLKRSEELGVKHNIPGGVPVDYSGNVNRRLLKVQLKKSRELLEAEVVSTRWQKTPA